MCPGISDTIYSLNNFWFILLNKKNECILCKCSHNKFHKHLQIFDKLCITIFFIIDNVNWTSKIPKQPLHAFKFLKPSQIFKKLLLVEFFASTGNSYFIIHTTIFAVCVLKHIFKTNFFSLLWCILYKIQFNQRNIMQLYGILIYWKARFSPKLFCGKKLTILLFLKVIFYKFWQIIVYLCKFQLVAVILGHPIQLFLNMKIK